jgi:hypothetical protein
LIDNKEIEESKRFSRLKKGDKGILIIDCRGKNTNVRLQELIALKIKKIKYPRLIFLISLILFLFTLLKSFNFILSDL